MKTKHKKEMKIIGIPVETNVQECISPKNKLPKIWEEFTKRMSEINDKVNLSCLGVSFTKSTKDCSFTYICGIEVKEVKDIPEGMISVIVPESDYAVYTHKGPLKCLGETYAQATEELKGKEKSFWFELYDKRFKKDSEDSELEIWCAIK